MTFKGNKYSLLLFRLLTALILLSISRMLLYFFNINHFEHQNAAQLLNIYFLGLRFDISALMMLNFLLILFTSQPFRFKQKKKVMNIVLYLSIALNSLAISSNLIDVIYFRFTLKRSTYDLFSFIGTNVGIADIFKNFFIDYWYMILLGIALIALLAFFFLRFRKSESKEIFTSFPKRLIVFILFGGLVVLGMRGGIQLKPLNLIDANRMIVSRKVPLIVNTPFSIIVTRGQEKLTNYQWFKPEETQKYFNPIHQFSKDTTEMDKKNVVILILESFSANRIGYFNDSTNSLTPFLDSLLIQSLTFKGTANGKKSIEGIPAILSGIPSLMRQPFLTSVYASNSFSGMADVFAKNGYRTAFFHGGKNGTMNFDSYAAKSGFQNYFGMNEYNNEEDYDGSWGIWDHDFYPYFNAQLSQMQEPFFAAFFSLSSHHPYAVPTEYKDRFSKGEPIDNSLAYADFALSQFFEEAKTSDWFSNTLFVLSADHSAELPGTADSSNLVYFEIPIAFYAPGDSLIKHLPHRKNIQQSDIFPSIANYLHLPNAFIAFGNSVFDTTAPDFSLYYLNEMYHVVQNNQLATEFDGTDFYSPEEKQNSALYKQVKAFIQTYNNRMINNQLIPTQHEEKN